MNIQKQIKMLLRTMGGLTALQLIEELQHITPSLSTHDIKIALSPLLSLGMIEFVAGRLHMPNDKTIDKQQKI